MRRENNFDFLRLAAAFLVIYGHGLVIRGLTMQDFWGVPIHSFGLFIFFIISGYLVSDSWLRTPTLPIFVWKRFLRLGPALFVVVGLTVFVFGPLVTHLSLTNYFAAGQTWAYLGNAFLLFAPGLPGVFDTPPLAGTVNSSLWSLPVEVACYVTVPIACVLAPKIRVPTLCAGAVALGLLGTLLFGRDTPLIVLGTNLAPAASVIPYFLTGAAVRALQPALPLRLDFAVVLIFALLIVQARFPQQLQIALWFLLPYVIISFGLVSTPVLRKAATIGDLSYGLYLYAFPVERLLHELIGRSIGFYAYVAVSTLGTACLAFASWHLIEKRALRLKKAAIWTRDALRAVDPASSGLAPYRTELVS
jgi:peptidoglycan/LPS O-acetylase OafA/YrhL